nr:MAG TPA: Ribosome biosynthesis protein [Caudoviricetes sp.]DAS98507.1 MAG TPA: Ribosome biosynthesis protein [Caudoviricetes sp.]
MAKKIQAIPMYVKCMNCRYASDFIGNSCFCKIKNHRVCACGRYGRICDKFKKR